MKVTCFLAGLFATNQAKSALVLAPKSVMRGWEDELGRWLVKTACPKTEVMPMPCFSIHNTAVGRMHRRTYSQANAEMLYVCFCGEIHLY